MDKTKKQIFKMATVKGQKGIFYCSNAYEPGFFYYSPNGIKAEAYQVKPETIMAWDGGGHLMWAYNGALLIWGRKRQLAYIVENIYRLERPELKIPSKNKGNMAASSAGGAIGALIGFFFGVRGFLAILTIALPVIAFALRKDRIYYKELCELCKESPIKKIPSEYIAILDRYSKSTLWIWYIVAGVLLFIFDIMILALSVR